MVRSKFSATSRTAQQGRSKSNSLCFGSLPEMLALPPSTTVAFRIVFDGFWQLLPGARVANVTRARRKLRWFSG